MANLKFITDNRVNDNDNLTLALGSTAAGHPLSNILTEKKVKTWRSTNTNAQQISISWPTTETMGGFALAFTNLVSGNEFRIRAYDHPSAGSLIFDSGLVALLYNQKNPAGFSTIGADSFSFGGGTYCSVFTTNMVNVRRVVVDISAGSNPDGYFEISRLILGKSWSPEIDPDFGASFKNNDNTTTLRTSAGDVSVNRGIQFKSLQFTNSWLTFADTEGMAEALRVNGNHTPVFVSLLSNETNFLYQAGQIYGRFTETSIAYSTYANLSASIEILEV